MKTGISCIICAYNEEPRIEAVLKAVIGHPLVNEVIVVNDGSFDGTASMVLAHPEVKLVDLKQNMGKSSAMAKGIEISSFETLLLLDADLIGLTPENISSLIKPVTSGRADMTVSLRANSLPLYKMIGMDFISGERVFKKSLLAHKLKDIKGLPAFALETFINRCAVEEGFRFTTVRFDNVFNTRKQDKTNLWQGIKAEARMMHNIFQVESLPRFVSLMYKMRRRKNSKSE